ncbi:recombination-associated protein RdgC [Gilvimarinus sp. SDUM040013]|uniref:Recombination-associated protein RdgC n=1 Tax=Gilvimarinus gilvus TaxID=3058038 RepID=A0ABU4S026_9GAMM|nr:recombination-associated protein RdgC [Gilvimarinus sp. SDUM040013]MDO3385220.1 recombination-associated protein RdgC [Gilvimarinus sp. SDUM040013]MDX6849203.1 recombination-associated protein RdgC [Gilvimarinus sp. SDUM040013]
MWYKNLRVFRLQDEFTLTPEALAEHLESAEFVPCGKMDLSRYGWVSPLGPDGQSLVHAANGLIALCAKKQDKILPAGVIKEQLEDAIRDIKTKESRPVSRKEREHLKEEITFSLLPQAFAKSSVDHAYIDTANRLLIIDTGSANRAEELISTLREALGSLRCIPLSPHNAVTNTLTHWLKGGNLPADFTLGDECELMSSQDERIIRGKKLDLLDEQLTQHLDTGMFVSKLAIHWKETISCVVDDQFCFKRVKFADSLLERAGDRSPDTLAEQFDHEFAIMGLELTAFIKAALHAFGGEAEGEFT